MKKIYLLLFSVLLFSCENNEISIDADNLLLGFWSSPIYEGETITFKRTNSFPKEAYAISFTKNGNFIEHTSGWCGTPPLSFFTIDGTYQLENELIHIATQSYPTNYSWRIVSLSEENLVVKVALTAQEIEHRVLMDLYNELYELGYSETCSDNSDWTFTAFGAKACGGPQGYIPYSKKIDVGSFLQKVEAYTEAEKAYNIKWGIVSDCSLAAMPTDIECQNGFPTLMY